MTAPDEDTGNLTPPINGTPVRRRLAFDKHRDWILILLAFGILFVLLWREVRLADESTEKQEARSTAVSLAAQVQSECDDPVIGVDLAICQQAEQIIEDPDNPPPPDLPKVGEPGPPGKDAPPPTPERVRAAVAELIQAAVAEWFAANPPMAQQGPQGERGPQGEQGPRGEQGPAGTMTCPGGAEPVQFTFKGTANIGLPKGTYLICPA